MAKITRKTSKLFAISGAGTDVEQFGAFQANGTPNYTTNPATIQALSAWAAGWTATQFSGVFAPYFQDRNAVDLVMLYQISYLLQQGIPEWDSSTPYFINSVVQNGSSIYLSLQDNNTGNTPPSLSSNSFWRILAFPSINQSKNPTRTVLTSGSGTYTPPSGCLRVLIRMVGGGGGGGGNGSTGGGENAGSNGGATTISSYTAGGGGGASNFGLTPGTGGAASGGDVNIAGAWGGNLLANHGGISKLGGAGSSAPTIPGVTPGTAGNSAAANSGSGGSGAGRFSSGGPAQIVTGGGAGGYLEVVVTAPAAMSYSVGAGGAGGALSTNHGGNGGSGVIIIDEFYY